MAKESTKLKLFLLDQTTTGGIERAVANMANYFSEYTNYQVEIVSIFKENQVPAYNISKNVKITFLRKDVYELYPIFKRILSNIHIISALWNYRTESDTIIISNLTNISDYLILFKHKHKAKIFAYEHGYHAAFGVVSQLVRKILFPYANLIITLTEREKCYFENISKNVICIPNAVSFYPEHTANLSSKRVISAGRLVKEKGYDVLINVYKTLSEKYPDWEFVIFGSGYLQNELEVLLRNCTSNIKLFAQTKHIEEELLKSSIYVCSSYTESFSISIVEAMACGLPVVSFDCPTGPREIIQDGIDGDLVPFGDTDLLANKIKELIEDTEKRKRYSITERENVKRFLPEFVYKQFEYCIGVYCE
ncbi:glycosyl transferase [Spirochaetia bacterium]|nr:glycosyl transferase [Spirochaetia bacterium]